METESKPQEATECAKGTKPQLEHQWLQKLVGEWTSEAEMSMQPGQPPLKTRGTESVRSLEGVWVVAEGQGETPNGGTATTMLTLGYDVQKKRYVGTWVGSMMTCLWVYDGELNAEETSLSLHAEGPAMVGEGKTATYKDVIAFQDDDHRTLTSYAQGEDGEWHAFMTVHYQRKK